MAMMRHNMAQRRGFTLLEILIVASLIGLFASLALFSIQQMYDQNREKLMFPEAQQIGTALSFARDDIGFYPRIHLLREPIPFLIADAPGGRIVRPHFDTYGFLTATVRADVIESKWGGPYGVKAQRNLSQGQRSYVKMRLPDTLNVGAFRGLFQQQSGADISLVDWPADTWANPWMVYHVTVDRQPNGSVRYRIAQPGESGDFFNAVVSYGRNRVPGGNMETELNDAAYFQFLLDNRMYLDGDAVGGTAEYTLKVVSSAAPGAQIDQDNFSDAFRDTIHFPGTANPDFGQVGMFDDGSDDIIWVF